MTDSIYAIFNRVKKKSQILRINRGQVYNKIMLKKYNIIKLKLSDTGIYNYVGI